MDELADALRSGQIAQAHAAEVHELGAWWKASADQQRHRLREQHLPAVRGVHDVLRAIDDSTEVIVVPPLGDAQMQAAAHAQRDVGSGGRIGEFPLQPQGGAYRVDRVGKCCVKAVAGHLGHRAALGFDGGADDCVVGSQCKPHALRRLRPKASAAFDVGEEKGRDGRSVGHAAKMPQLRSEGDDLRGSYGFDHSSIDTPMSFTSLAKTLPAARPLRSLREGELQARFDKALAAGDGVEGAHCIHERWMRNAFPSHIEAALTQLWTHAADSIPEWLPMHYVSWLPRV